MDYSFSPIDHESVETVLMDSNPNKSTGVDQIPSKYYAMVASEIYLTITALSNYIIITCIFPDEAKLSQFTPVYKKNDSWVKTSHRPVSILPGLSKVLPSIINSQLCTFLGEILNSISTFRRG